MGFQTGNILEPSMGVGNFFGLLPEQMQLRKLGRVYFTYEVLCVLSQVLTQLLAGRLNRNLSVCQNCRAFARTYIWYNATISGIVTIHSRVVTTLIALA